MSFAAPACPNICCLVLRQSSTLWTISTFRRRLKACGARTVFVAPGAGRHAGSISAAHLCRAVQSQSAAHDATPLAPQTAGGAYSAGHCDRQAGAVSLSTRWLDAQVRPPLSIIATELAFLVRLAHLGTRETMHATRVAMPNLPDQLLAYEQFLSAAVVTGK